MRRALFFTVFGYLTGSILFARLLAGLTGKEIIARSKDNNPGTASADETQKGTRRAPSS